MPKARPASQNHSRPKQPREISPTYLRNSGLFYLQRYVASTSQFRRVMGRKIERSCRFYEGADPEQCFRWLDELIHEFQELGYLNDERYLQGMIHSLRSGKGASSTMIASKLQQKGFSFFEIEKALLEYDNAQPEQENPEYMAAIRFAQRKKLGPYHPTPPKKSYEQQLAVLARAGFPYALCKEVLAASQKDPED